MPTERLICEDCGTLNSVTRQRCELCGESLSEELERARLGSLPLLCVAAIGITALCVVLPAVGLFLYATQMREVDISPTTFGVLYLVAWGVLGVVGQRYSPRSQYDFGWSMGNMGHMDNPLSLRDNMDRSHASLGVVLLPVNLTVGAWLAVWRRLRA